MEFMARKSYDCVSGKDTSKDFVGCGSMSDRLSDHSTEYPSNLPPKKMTPFVGKTVGMDIGTPVRSDVVTGSPVAR
jgi:hypothetical protein